MEATEKVSFESQLDPVYKQQTPRERLLERKKYHEESLAVTNRALELLDQDPNVREILEILWG